MSFEAEWARCAPWLDAALAHGGRTHSLVDVAAMIAQGKARFWSGARCAAVTVLEEDPSGRWAMVWLAGGELADLVETVRPRIEAWAREQGCRRLLVLGRPGWERALKRNGYAPTARIISKEL